MHLTSLVRHRMAEGGSVFLLAIVILTVILVLGASLIEKAQTSVYRATVDSRFAKSFHLAEAGIHKALWELNQPNGWLTYDGQGAVTLPGGLVDVAVAPDPALRSVFTNTVTVMATGYLPGPAGAQRLPCTIRVITHKDPSYFDYAVFAEDQVIIGNGTGNPANLSGKSGCRLDGHLPGTLTEVSGSQDGGIAVSRAHGVNDGAGFDGGPVHDPAGPGKRTALSAPGQGNAFQIEGFHQPGQRAIAIHGTAEPVLDLLQFVFVEFKYIRIFE